MSDCSSCAITFRAAACALMLSLDSASAAPLRSFIGSERTYATTLAACASVRSRAAGIAVPGIPFFTTAAIC